MMADTEPMNWDPEVESPATIAIIGGGPVGIEAALYARFLGYYVELFEAHRIVGRVTAMEDLPMSMSLGEACSALGRKAIATQDPSKTFPDLNRTPTYQEWADEYLLPLARTDLIFDSIHVHTPVKSISRLTTGNGARSTNQERANDQFRLLVESQNRGEWTSLADVILDCSGWSSQSVGLAPGGGKAIGELSLRDEIMTRIPSLIKLTGAKHWVLWGSSPQAITTVRKFVAAGKTNPDLRLTWFMPMHAQSESTIKEAREALASGLEKSATVGCLGIESLAKIENGKWQVRVAMPGETTIDVQSDHVIGLPSPVIDKTFQIELARSFARVQSEPTLEEQSSNWPGWRLSTLEPHYYILGSKAGSPLSEMSSNDWLAMQRQIRDLFAMLGGRENLDLYSDFAKRESQEQEHRSNDDP